MAMVYTWVQMKYLGTFKEKCLKVSKFQCSWLELQGALTWFTKVYNKMLTDIEGELEVLDCMGAFTDNCGILVSLWILSHHLCQLHSNMSRNT
jgi:hypothetical protein